MVWLRITELPLMVIVAPWPTVPYVLKTLPLLGSPSGRVIVPPLSVILPPGRSAVLVLLGRLLGQAVISSVPGFNVICICAAAILPPRPVFDAILTTP